MKVKKKKPCSLFLNIFYMSFWTGDKRIFHDVWQTILYQSDSSFENTTSALSKNGVSTTGKASLSYSLRSPSSTLRLGEVLISWAEARQARGKRESKNTEELTATRLSPNHLLGLQQRRLFISGRLGHFRFVSEGLLFWGKLMCF